MLVPSGGGYRNAHAATRRLARAQTSSAWRLVVIADAYSVAHARMVAAGLEPGTFVDGHRVSRASVARLPVDVVGRVLTLTDLIALAEKTIGPVQRLAAGAAHLGRT